jgi:nicotinamide-nucleotide amidase
MAASSSQPARRPGGGPITAELLCIGSELTSGHVLNTNVCYLSQQLAGLGIHTLFHTSVGDEAGPMAEALGIASRRADVVIVTGGLGPTADDFTRDIIAQVAGKKLLRHEPSVEAIQERFRRFGTTPTENNLQQAFLPEGAEVVPNPRGTAPGFALLIEQAVVIALPGVPSEMQAMFEEWVAPHLRGLGYASGVRVTRQLHCFGAGESAIDARIRHLMAPDRNPVVALLAQEGTITVKLTAAAESPAEASRLLDDTERELRGLVGDLIFGRDGEGLEDAVAKLLLAQGKTLAVAESCTGGLVSSLLTRVPGISAAFLLGVVAYSNEAKTALLGVPEGLIRTHGAVSAEVARAMAEGALVRASADLACALTGIAGPSGGTPDKPVGLVWMAVADGGGTEVFQRNFRGGRAEVQLRAAKAMLAALRARLLAGKA